MREHEILISMLPGRFFVNIGIISLVSRLRDFGTQSNRETDKIRLREKVKEIIREAPVLVRNSP